ncbi:hypothetical protein Tco_1062684 [Tanacetum coccineum]
MICLFEISNHCNEYGSGVARPKIEDKDNFELKGQFLKELRINTFNGLDHEDANEHIKKVLEIVDLFHITNITIDQVMLRAFHMSLTGATSRWLRNEPTSSITTWDGLKTKFLNKYSPPARTAKKMEEINNFKQEPDENLYQAGERFKELMMKCPHHYLTEMMEVILSYNGLGIPTRQILNSRGAIPSKTVADAKIAIQEMPEYSQKFHNGTSRSRRGGYRAAALGFYQRNNVNPSYQERRQSMEDTLSKFMSESTKRHEENSNLIKEIQASTDAAIRNQGASIKTLEIQIGQMNKVLQERGFGSLPSSTEANPRDQVKSISTTIKADSCLIHRIGSSQYAVSTGQSRTLMYEIRQTMILFPSRLNGYYCEEKKGSYGPQFSEAYSKASQSIPQKEKDLRSFTLPYFIDNVCFDNALVLLRANTVKYPKGIDENILVGIGKFTFPVDFIILDMPKDIKVPLILGRPFLSTTRDKIDVYKRKITLRVREGRIIFTSVKPASSLIKRVYMLTLRERMELDLEARIMGKTLVLNRSLDPFLEDDIELNDIK